MTKAVLIANGSNALTLASGEEFNLIGWNNESATEANTQISCTEGATFSGMRIRITGGGSGTNTFRFRDAGADGNQVASGTGAALYEDVTNSDVLSAGDLFNISYVDTGSNSTMAWVAANVEFASGYGCFHGCANFTGTVCDVPSATQYFSLAGLLLQDGEAASNIARQQWKNRAYTSWEAMQVRVTANARTNTSEFKNDINGSAGTGICSFAAGVTGLVEDTGIGDSVADGDLLCHSLTLSTGVEDLTVASIVSTLKSTNTKQEVIAYIGGGRAASATEHFFACGGYANDITAYTEAQARCKIGYAGTATRLRAYLSANTYTVAGVLTCYKNGVSAMTVEIPALGGAGWIENSADSFTFDDDDELSFSLVGGTTGSITVFQVGMTLAPQTATTTAVDTDGVAVGTLTTASRVSVDLSGAGAAVGTLAASATITTNLAATGAAVGTLEATDAGGVTTADLAATGAAVGTLTTAANITADLAAAGAAVGTLAVASSVTTNLAATGAAVGTLEAVDGATVTTADLVAAGAATGTLATEAAAAAALVSDGVAVGTLEAEADQGFVTTDLSATGSSTAILVPASINAVALVSAGAGVGTLDTGREDNAYLRWGNEAARRRRELEEDDEEVLQMVALLAPRLFGRGARL